MSRAKKKRKRRTPSGHDSHHLLFVRRAWDRGYKLLLRRSFIYEIPIAVHQALHAAIEPMPPLTEDEARELWAEFKLVDYDMDIFEALDWLQQHAPNAEFAMAIMAQAGFLQNNMGRS